MTVQIHEDACIGCGFCREQLPQVFYLDGFSAQLDKKGLLTVADNEILQHNIRTAAEMCPGNAIEIVEDALQENDTQA